MNLRMEEVAEIVAQAFGVTVEDLRGAVRQRWATVPRNAFMAHAQRYAGAASPKIAAYLGRDHTTVINGVRRSGELFVRDGDYRAIYLSVAERLRDLQRKAPVVFFVRHGKPLPDWVKTGGAA